MELKGLRKYIEEELLPVYRSYDCIVTAGGERVARLTGGFRDENGTPIRGDETYNMYSCSKPLTCAAALTLLEKGAFRLSDDLAEYFPETGDTTVKSGCGVRPSSKRIKIVDLFTMTAGFDYNVDTPSIKRFKADTDGKCPTILLPKYLAAEPLSFEPGESWQYSLCHDVIAALVEKVSGERFGDYVKRVIFEPLGMKNSTYSLADVNSRDFCTQRTYDSEKKAAIPCGNDIKWYKLGADYESGGAGCVSTADDFALFLEGMRTFKVLKEETIELMTRDYLNDYTRQAFWSAKKGYGYGLGVTVPALGSGNSDYGWGGAAGSFLRVDGRRELTVFFATHCLCSPIADKRAFILDYAARDLGL